MKTNNLHFERLLIIFGLTVLLIPPLVHAEVGQTKVIIGLENTNGDRINPSGAIIKIYDANDQLVHQITKKSNSPYFETKLQSHQKYHAEIFLNGILTKTYFFDIPSNEDTVIDIQVPNSAGVSFQVLFNDSNTPVANADITLKNYKGDVITNSKTDLEGRTIRFWIAPTLQTYQYYFVEVKLHGDLIFESYKIKPKPSTQMDKVIVTDWPSSLGSISVSLQNQNGQMLGDYEKMRLELYDDDGEIHDTSGFSRLGKATFSSIPLGQYHALAYDDESLVANTTINLMPNTAELTILSQQKEDDKIQVSFTQDVQAEIESTPAELTCKCVAFRLDDIQNFWLNEVQIGIIETFREKNAPLTIGIIGNSFGDDITLLDYIKDRLGDKPSLVIANHGWEHTSFKKYDISQQESSITKTNDKLYKLLGVRSHIFIPPLNDYNEDTIETLKENGFTHFSSEFDKSEPPYTLNGQVIYNFPEGAYTGDLNEDESLFFGVDHQTTFSQIEYSLNQYGFAVVTMHPQEFSVVENGTYTNKINEAQMEQLELLIDKIRQNSLKIVTLDKINIGSPISNSGIPSWIKNNAKWWSEGRIDDSNFITGIQFLIQEKIMIIPPTEQTQATFETNKVPSWIKQNAAWWSEGQISDNDFVKGIQYLVEHGIIHV